MRTVSLGILLVAAASIAMAGHVYGTIRENNQPIRGVEVVLICGGERSSAKTDGEGVYRLFAKATGNCQLVLDPAGRNAAGPLYSYDRPTAYDFDLVRENGRWALRKR